MSGAQRDKVRMGNGKPYAGDQGGAGEGPGVRAKTGIPRPQTMSSPKRSVCP
jgi:hypothetical protein